MNNYAQFTIILTLQLFCVFNTTNQEIESKWADGTKWANAEQEALDEQHDGEIFQAVLTSVAEWQQRHRNRREKRAEPKVCYPEVGCFEESGYIDMLPSSPEEVNTKFLLYNSRSTRTDTPLMDVSAQNMSTIWDWAGKAFNVSVSTKVIIHGFGSSCSNVWVYEMRSALTSVENCNIICVDWEAGAIIPNYVRAAANARLVGKQVALLISGLQQHINLPIRNVHMIGFSLGAHVAGFAGSELKNLSRITGLDPAGPLFESQDEKARLDSSDAEFVDVIHSNGENLFLGGLGAWQSMGHVDFYPNGGRMQKGCTNLFVGAVSDMIWSANEVYGRSLCNHRRAYKFFTDSVSPRCHFPAAPCDSYESYLEGKCFPCNDADKCGNMGYYANKYPARGNLYLLTREEEPFCAHQYMVTIESAATDREPLISYGKIQIMLIGDLELNETFTITQKKDEKLISGEPLSRIIVPHPALQNFFKIQILYTAYSGWLSSGLDKWTVQKISLSNSYGQVLSACDEMLTLESGKVIVVPLLQYDCKVGEQNNQTKIEFPNRTDTVLWTQVIKIGNEILPRSNNSQSNITIPNTDGDIKYIGMGVTEYYKDPWKPLDYTEIINQNSNSIDKYDIETGRKFRQDKKIINETMMINLLERTTENRLMISDRSLDTATQNTNFQNTTTLTIKDDVPYKFVTDHPVPKRRSTNTPEIQEPVLKPKSTKSPSIRSHGSKSINIDSVASNTNYNIKSGDMIPPSQDATESWSHWNSTRVNNMTHNNNNESHVHSVIIQLLPQRLISFIEQAERYAKIAFAPFISSKDNNDDKSKKERSRRRLNLHVESSLPIMNERDLETSESKSYITSLRVPYGYQEQIYDQNIYSNKKYIPLISDNTKFESPKFGIALAIPNEANNYPYIDMRHNMEEHPRIH